MKQIAGLEVVPSSPTKKSDGSGPKTPTTLRGNGRNDSLLTVLLGLRVLSLSKITPFRVKLPLKATVLGGGRRSTVRPWRNHILKSDPLPSKIHSFRQEHVNIFNLRNVSDNLSRNSQVTLSPLITLRSSERLEF